MGFSKYISKKYSKNKSLNKRITEAGNAFVLLFGAVGMVGVLGASTMTIMKGPVKTMSEVTKRTITENNMIGATKLAIIVSASDPATQGDCDGDGTIEPVEMAGAHPSMTGASTIPNAIGVSKQDSWGTEMAYCTWDYGSVINGGGCAGDNRKTGGSSADQLILAVISAGPDKTFQSSCIDYVNSTTPVVSKPGGSDDLVLGYTESDAIAMSGGLWNLKSGSPDTAEISKKLEVSDGAAAQLQFDATTKTLQIGDGTGGSGLFPLIRTDAIDDYNQSGAAIDINSPIDVTGNIDSDSTITGAALVGAGSGITNLNASNLASGTLPDARLTGNYSGLGTVSATTFSGGGGSLTGLNASQLTAGTVPDARLTGNYSGLGTVSASIFTASTRVNADEFCDSSGGNCIDQADIGTGGGGGGGGGASCSNSTVFWGGCTATVLGGVDGTPRSVTDNNCCYPGCSYCSGDTGSASFVCNNGLWSYVSGSCSGCNQWGSCDGDDDGDCDESVKDLLKMRNLYKEFTDMAQKYGMKEEEYITHVMKEKREKGELR